jgi:hypothetical protein
MKSSPSSIENFSEMNIILSSVTRDPFARVSKQLLDDPKLSWKAKGIMAYLLGKPPKWKLRVTDLVKKSSDGKHAIRAALKELQVNGYATFERVRLDGKIVDTIWKVADSPLFLPKKDLQHPESQNVENQHHSKNNTFSKNDFNKNETSLSSSDAFSFDELVAEFPLIADNRPELIEAASEDRLKDNSGLKVWDVKSYLTPLEVKMEYRDKKVESNRATTNCRYETTSPVHPPRPNSRLPSR